MNGPNKPSNYLCIQDAGGAIWRRKQRKLKRVNENCRQVRLLNCNRRMPAHRKRRLFSIVGIGASAGGLESLEQFFRHMPPDSGMAFVVVQHLDPTRHSSMPEIMSRLTSMTVHAAADGMKVVPNTIYLIPPNKNMGIQEGALFLQEPTQPHGLRLPVDFFLRSLAKEKGANAICVILSGTGTDGTLGLRAIKAELGTVFVQEPKSARYDGMPRSAINTGLADFVLPPEEMPQQLMRFARRSAVNGARISAAGEKANKPLQQVFAILRTRTGHDFSRYKQSTILRRLERRMSVNGIDNISDYSRFLGKNESEVRAFLKDILISVTSFFRDPGAFDALKEKVCELDKRQRPGQRPAGLGARVRYWRRSLLDSYDYPGMPGGTPKEPAGADLRHRYRYRRAGCSEGWHLSGQYRRRHQPRTPETLLHQTGKFVPGEEKSEGNGGLCAAGLHQRPALFQDGPHLLPQSPYLPGKRRTEKATAASALCHQAWRYSLFGAL